MQIVGIRFPSVALDSDSPVFEASIVFDVKRVPEGRRNSGAVKPLEVKVSGELSASSSAFFGSATVPSEVVDFGAALFFRLDVGRFLPTRPFASTPNTAVVPAGLWSAPFVRYLLLVRKSLGKVSGLPWSSFSSI